jgi:hypothetical protein
MSGIPGCGKSSYAECVLLLHTRHNARYEKGRARAAIVSADDYYMVGGEYKYDPTKIGDAHADCFRRFISYMMDPEYDFVVVDNTSCTVEEIAPYMLGAAAFEWDAEVRTIVCATEDDMKVAAARNTHKAPFEVVSGQWNTLCARRLPAWWTHTGIPMSQAERLITSVRESR